MPLEDALALSLTVSNGPWGVLDPGLRGHKYLVLAQAPGLTATPPAYEVVVQDGKFLLPSSGVEFVFESK
jgi:hypothetical protein